MLGNLFSHLKHKIPNKKLSWLFNSISNIFAPPPNKKFPEGFVSPHLNFTNDPIKLVKNHINNYALNISSEITLLDVGGRNGEQSFLGLNIAYWK